VIDFEAWRPVWAQNWGTLNVYRTLSIDVERRRDPSATRKSLEIRVSLFFFLFFVTKSGGKRRANSTYLG